MIRVPYPHITVILSISLSLSFLKHYSPVNRICPAKLCTPSPRRRPPTTSEEEEEEVKAARRKWRCCCPIRKLLPTSRLSYVPLSKPLAPTFWLARPTSSCRTLSPSSTLSCSGKKKGHVSTAWFYCQTIFASFQHQQTTIVPVFPNTIFRTSFCML